jgi:mannitol/fructose-specific phosphotransferase system IIA component
MAPQILQYWPVFVAATLVEAFAERGKKRFPYALGNGIAVCHSVCLVQKTTVSPVAFNKGRFHSISTLIAKVIFCRWIVDVGQHMHFLFVLEIIAVKSHVVLALMFPHFNFIILWSMLPGIPLL